MGLSVSFAQKSTLKSAIAYLQDNDIEKAKQAIDAAVVHPNTANELYTWTTRGDVYYAIYTSKDPRIKQLHPQPEIVAFESYVKATKLDTKNEYQRQIEGKISDLNNFALNDGVVAFNKKDFQLAIHFFSVSIETAQFASKTDSLAIYNRAMAYERKGDYKKAIENYQYCVDIGYKSADCCIYIVELYQEVGDQEKVNEQLDKCQEQFPDNESVMIAVFQNYLNIDNQPEAIRILKELIITNPKNHSYYFLMGSLMEKTDPNAAETYYKKALEHHPDYFEANYNLGALYYNQGVEMNNKAIITEDQAYSKELEKQTNELFRKAQLYLEKAHQLAPKNQATLASLIEIYRRFEMTAQLEETTKKLELLK
jgi:tetratricopeptide (TPR) repeat protein